ncbi:hypothetical protein WA158_005650 [Blastocystis sp. Blastoise]
MRKWQLEESLQSVEVFREPNYMLEQYPTSAHLASCILHTASNNGDIEGKCVADIGCGTSMLSIAAALSGSSYTVGFDIDLNAINVARENAKSHEVNIDYVHVNVNDLANETYCKREFFDTVIMNPPFGTRNKGIDVTFLRAALNISNHAVYSLHKTSTRDFLVKKINDWGYNVTVVAQLVFDIPAMYKFHTKQSADIEVDLLYIEKGVPITKQDSGRNGKRKPTSTKQGRR